MCGQLPPNQRRSMTATVAPRGAGLVRGGLAGRAGADDHEVERFHRRQCLPRLGGSPRALADGLVEQHGRGDRDVQAVGDAAHRDRDRLDSRRRARSAPRPSASLPSTMRERAAEVGVGVRPRARRRRAATSRMPRSAQPGERPPPTAPATTGSAKIVPSDRPDRVRVEEVRPRVGGDHGVGAGAVGGAQDRAEVAGLLDALDDDERAARPGRPRGPRARVAASRRSPRPRPSGRRTRPWRGRPRLTSSVTRPVAASRSAASTRVAESGAAPARRTPPRPRRRRRGPGAARAARRRSSGPSPRARAGRAAGPRP